MSSTSAMLAVAGQQALLESISPTVKIIAFVGPSGAGKTRFINTLLEREPRLRRMFSVTTRRRRDNDPAGEYEYVTHDRFQSRIYNGAFLWTTNVHGNRYGTLKRSVDEALQGDVPTVMHLEPNSVPKLLATAGPAVKLFYVTAPPEDLEGRLRRRDPDRDEGYYFERIQSCRQWESDARKSDYPYHFLDNPNGGFEEAFADLVSQLSE